MNLFRTKVTQVVIWIYKNFFALLPCLSMTAVNAAAGEPRLSAPVAVFTGGAGYPNYRTPSLTAMPDGSLLAIAEGRSFDDPGIGMSDLDIVSRRSFDGGATWGPMQVVDTWAGGANSNPTTVLDKATGRLFVLFNRWEGFLGTTDSQPGTTNNSAWMRYSDDNGATWSTPRDLTAAAKDVNNWNSVAFGPGSGIQASNGRLIIPSARWANGWGSYVVYSADSGQTWTRGQLLPGGNLSNENQLVQLADGRIHMEARANTAGEGPRVTSKSTNGGLTWSATTPGQNSPSVHAAVERFSLQSTAAGDVNRILYTGPSGPDRSNLVVRTSYDETVSYVNQRLLYEGYSGYSDITILQDGSVGVLFETGEARNLTYLSFNREWIEPPQRLRGFDSFRYNSATVPELNGGINFSAGWTAAPDLTGPSATKTRTFDLNYTNFPFVNEGRRSVLFDNGGSLARPLPGAIDLGGDETYYFSLLIQQNNIGIDNETAQEALNFSLFDGTNEAVSFGIRGDERIYVEIDGSVTQSPANAIDKAVAYYLVAKLVPSAAGVDEVFVKAFRSGDVIPAADDGAGWTLAGAGLSGAVLDRIHISGGAQADWLIDEFRFGTSFGAVVSNVLRHEWTNPVDGNWIDNSNWFDGAPRDADDTAIFGPTGGSLRTVTLEAARTIGSLQFTGGNYRISGFGTITLTGAIEVGAGSHEILTTLALPQSANVEVAVGARLFTPAVRSESATSSLGKTGAGLWRTGAIETGSVSISAGTLQLASTMIGLKAESLAVQPMGAIDLGSAAAIVDYTGESPGDAIAALVASARAGGAWNGRGIGSSQAGGAVVVGMVDTADVPMASFRGSALDDNAIVIALAVTGDADLSGTVNLDDFTALAANFGLPGKWWQGDFDYSGTVNLDDFTTLAANFGASALAHRSIPEPAATAAVALLLIGRRRRRSGLA